MGRKKSKRNQAKAGKPTSPPQTPPPNKSKAGEVPTTTTQSKEPTMSSIPASITPLGVGPGFSYTRTTRIEQVVASAPTESEVPSESSDADDIDEDNLVEDDSSSSPMSIPGVDPTPPSFISITTTHIIEATFTVEELSDFDETKDIHRLDIIRPHEILDAESERSHSRTRQASELDRRFLEKVRALHCDGLSDSSSDSDLDEDEHQEHLRRQREERRRKRMSMGSVSKRTISERDSESDREDRQFVGADDTDMSDRRTKRRLDRRSLIFQDPPPRIDELDEPEEMEETIEHEEHWPFYSFLSIEVDSP